MNLSLHRVLLPLAHTFTISRESISTQPSLIVELEHDGVRGYGEVGENAYYGHTFASITASLERAAGRIGEYAERTPIELWPEMHAAIGGDTFALSALDMAAHDLRGKRLGIPTWQDWGLEWVNVPDSSYTIGIDTIDTMVAKLQEMPGWGLYKIKLGTPQDITIVTELRQHTDAVFRIDANCAWTAEETVVNSKKLADLGVEFIEQPLPMNTPAADKLRVFRDSALPVIADEDCQVTGDVDRCHGLYHGVNVKICKCGGLTPALAMLRRARELGLKTMVGCMIESSIGISGAAQLLPLLDYADLDGAVLLRDDPASGVTIDKGAVRLSGRGGCGGELQRGRLGEFVQGG
jgi:L-alanine-DL-glutamate epimerase-like enolase superfamily enzyme